MSTDDPRDACIELLWSEIPLEKEQHVLGLLREAGLYDTWETAMRVPSLVIPLGFCGDGITRPDQCDASSTGGVCDSCGLRQ